MLADDEIILIVTLLLRLVSASNVSVRQRMRLASREGEKHKPSRKVLFAIYVMLSANHLLLLLLITAAA